MAVLADLGDQDARAAALIFLEFGDEFLHPFDGVRHADLPSIDPGNRFDLRPMPPERLLQRRGNLADGRFGARRVDCQRQQVSVDARGAAGERFERLRNQLRIAVAFKPLELVDL